MSEDSDGQTLAALGATSVDDSAATAGLHADEEAMRAGAADFRSLVGAFHDQSGPLGPLLVCFGVLRCATERFAGSWFSGNLRLHQNDRFSSILLALGLYSHSECQRGAKLWITAPRRPCGTYNPTAPTRTFPQHER